MAGSGRRTFVVLELFSFLSLCSCRFLQLVMGSTCFLFGQKSHRKLVRCRQVSLEEASPVILIISLGNFVVSSCNVKDDPT